MIEVIHDLDVICMPHSNGQRALIDKDDLPRVEHINWCAKKNRRVTYACGHNPHTQKSVFLHRLIMNAKPGEQVDHINSEGCDCRKANMRLVTGSGNHWNCGPRQWKNKSSQYKGVSWVKRRQTWLAEIHAHVKRQWSQAFCDEVEAAKAYDAKAKQYHGEFCYQNFPARQEAANDVAV